MECAKQKMGLIRRMGRIINSTFCSTFSFLHVSALRECRNMQEPKGALIVFNFNA